MSSWQLSSTFKKMVLSFLLLGVLPMLCVCTIFLRQYENNGAVTIENNIAEANSYAQLKISDLIIDIDYAMEILYQYSSGEFDALYDILESEQISESERSMHIGLMLDEIIAYNPAISAAYFVTPDGMTYSRFYSQNKSLHSDATDYHSLPQDSSQRLRHLFVLPAAQEADWCNNSSDTVISLARNYMDTRSLKAVQSVSLGTLYLDVNITALSRLLTSIHLGTQGNAAIVDSGSAAVLYQLTAENNVPLPAEFIRQGGSFSDDNYLVFYEPINRSSYFLLLSFDRQELYSTYTANRSFFYLVLAAAVIFVLTLALGFSNRMSKPGRMLKQAMGQLQQGNLNVRVDIHSGDEMEALGEGFNHMVEQLSETIEEVYVAELCQRNAELNALKMQVQPHYLYNTLDVIRMSSLESGDAKSARLIESLSRQLRYVMGDHQEQVPLRQELDSLQEYGVLMHARYEGRIRLQIEVRDEDLSLMVPKLLLQPFVENAIKHGLREKEEGGTVLIEVTRLEQLLQIVVVNDGRAIEPERLAHIRHFLAHAAIGEQDEEGIVSVGMKNTYDRIKLNCGAAYGFAIESDEYMGVLVRICLPIVES